MFLRALLICSVLLSRFVWAEPQARTLEPIFRSDTRLVVLHATVTDPEGKLVTNLPRSAFHVFEDGVEQHLTVFRQEDAPISLGLVIDNSASMAEKRPRVEAAGLALVRASNPGDEVFVVNFNDNAFLDQDFTNDVHALEQGIARIDSQGTTALRDALNMALVHLRMKGKEDKKVLLVVTDGFDNSSTTTLEYLTRAAQQNNVLIYAVGLLKDEDPAEAERATRTLKTLAAATGGQAFFPGDVTEVNRIALEVAHDIRNQYTLAYTPINVAADGQFRKIQVVVDGPNLSVRTRSGYYATSGPITSAETNSAQIKGIDNLHPWYQNNKQGLVLGSSDVLSLGGDL